MMWHFLGFIADSRTDALIKRIDVKGQLDEIYKLIGKHRFAGTKQCLINARDKAELTSVKPFVVSFNRKLSINEVCISDAFCTETQTHVEVSIHYVKKEYKQILLALGAPGTKVKVSHTSVTEIEVE